MLFHYPRYYAVPSEHVSYPFFEALMPVGNWLPSMPKNHYINNAAKDFIPHGSGVLESPSLQ
ncbi:MAG: hypothetical protein ACLR0U_32625 [Enterocloster clostridioformis]